MFLFHFQSYRLLAWDYLQICLNSFVVLITVNQITTKNPFERIWGTWSVLSYLKQPSEGDCDHKAIDMVSNNDQAGCGVWTVRSL